MKIKNKDGINRAIIALLFLSYLIVLLWVVVFKCNVNSQLNIERNLARPLWDRFTDRIIPFIDIYYMLIGKMSFYNILAFFFNPIVCVPGGMLLGFFVKLRRGLLYSFIFILGIEIFQLFSGWGGFEPTDVIMNLLGVLFGYLIHNALYRVMSAKAINTVAFYTLCIAAPFAVFVVIRTILNFPV